MRLPFPPDGLGIPSPGTTCTQDQSSRVHVRVQPMLGCHQTATAARPAKSGSRVLVRSNTAGLLQVAQTSQPCCLTMQQLLVPGSLLVMSTHPPPSTVCLPVSTRGSQCQRWAPTGSCTTGKEQPTSQHHVVHLSTTLSTQSCHDTLTSLPLRTSTTMPVGTITTP
jgi:hypothetical protein